METKSSPHKVSPSVKAERPDIAVPFKFRFPVKQTADNEVMVMLPMGDKPTTVVHIDEEFAASIGLTTKEYDDAVEAAEHALWRSLVLIK